MTPAPDDVTPDDLTPETLPPDSLLPDPAVPGTSAPDPVAPDTTSPAELGHAEPGPAERWLAELLARTPVSSTDLGRLHIRLEDTARRRAVLDLAYSTVATPVGVLLLVRSEHGLVRVAYDVEDHDRVLQDLSETLSPRVLWAPGQLSEATRQVEEYFGRRRTEFDLPLDFSLSRGFRQDVQRHLVDISYGRTRSYTEVAALVGRPRAVRAVGSACATNPLPVVVPCHRVLRSDGSLGGYIGGLAAKTALLELERAA